MRREGDLGAGGGGRDGNEEGVWWLTKYGEYLQLPLFGIAVKRKGCQYPDGPCVIVCNHQSALDSVVMMHEEIWPGDCVVIMKNSMKYSGPFGLCLVLAGTIFVNRKNSASAKEMMRSAADAIQENKYRVWIFPEGTRKLSMKGKIEEHFLPFKKGAFNLAVMAQVPIVPVVFSSQEKFFSVHRHIFEPGETTATILPAVSTEGMTLEDVPRLTDEVRTKMLEAFTSH
ncbi:1-acyl-sn-glycerol-3-phosphate acyltransferase alpha-like [Diadema setosum]|uniref:1-acyl-sn-glycerol-3-phosphate acyltransferase alpha-like n=1 Tax=Diadema setosum TaxID=31175 RepID=UPI003B3A1358